MASETHIHHLKTALDEQTYFSLSDLRALTTERFSRKQPSDTYLSVDEMQEMRRSAVKADYMSIDPTRKMLGTEKEPDYLSIHQSFGSGRNPVSPDYLTVDEANRCAGQNEANYLSLEESRALLQRGGQSDGDYLSIATGDWCPVYPRSDNPLESDYLSLDQVVAMKEIFDDAYLSVEEMNMLAKEAKCKLNTQDTTYLSIEEMQHLAGGQAPFKALVSSVLKSQSSKTASKGDQQLLGDIRDKLLVDAINHGRHVLEGDAIFAHQLQKQEIAVAQKCERAINEAQLLSLERIYRKTVPGAVEPPPILKNSFTNLIKAWQKPQFVRKSVPQAPDFDKFDRQSEFASTTASKLIGILSKSGQLDVETIEDAFQIAAAVVKRVENGLDALGEANEMEVCDGIYPCMLRMLLHSVWQSARKLLAKDDKKNYQNTLRARTYVSFTAVYDLITPVLLPLMQTMGFHTKKLLTLVLEHSIILIPG